MLPATMRSEVLGATGQDCGRHLEHTADANVSDGARFANGSGHHWRTTVETTLGHEKQNCPDLRNLIAQQRFAYSPGGVGPAGRPLLSEIHSMLRRV